MSKKLTVLSPFSKEYWKEASRECRKVNMIALAAMLIALRSATNFMRIPVGENLNIFFTYLISALGGSIYGPILAFISGAVYDILSFMIYPDGPFFIGYTLNTALAAAIYGLFLYRQRITVFKCFFAKFSNNLIVNVFLGSLWSAMLYSKGYIYYFMKSLSKNFILLPIEVLLMVVLFRTMTPFLTKRNLIVDQSKNKDIENNSSNLSVEIEEYRRVCIKGIKKDPKK